MREEGGGVTCAASHLDNISAWGGCSRNDRPLTRLDLVSNLVRKVLACILAPFSGVSPAQLITTTRVGERVWGGSSQPPVKTVRPSLLPRAVLNFAAQRRLANVGRPVLSKGQADDVHLTRAKPTAQHRVQSVQV